MFGCYHCPAQMDELQDLVAHSKTEQADVSANFSFRYFVKTKNIYQSIHLKYPVSHIPEDCHIYLQNGKLILRLCESPDQGTAEVHYSDTHPTKYRKLSSTPTKCTTSITESSNSITICEKDKSLLKGHFHTDFHMVHFYINSLRNVFVLHLEANTFHLNEN